MDVGRLRNSALYPRGTTKFTSSTVCRDLPQPNINMDVRRSFSRLKGKIKRLRSKRRSDGTGPTVDGESVGPAHPLPQQEPHVVAGGGPGADGRQACPTGQPLQPDDPELVSTSGSGNDQGGGEAGVDREEVSSMYSHPRPAAEVGAGSGPSWEGNGSEGEGDEQFYSCSSTPLTPCSVGPDGV